MSSSTQQKPIRAGVFSTVELADRAVENLMAAGFEVDQITVICSDKIKEQHFGSLRQREGIAETQQDGVLKSGVAGGVLGALVSLAGVAATGGVGILAVGPILAGGVTGTLAGIFIGRGVENELARFYDQAVAKGNILVAVEIESDHEDQAELLAKAARIISESGAKPLGLAEG